MADKKSFANEIKKFDKNLENLVNECLENDLSEAKVYKLINENIVKNASKKMNSIRRTRNLFTFLKVLGVTLTLAFLLTRQQWTTDLLKMMGRKMLISIQPIYDWTKFYETNCLVKNSRFEDDQNSLKIVANCNLCESVERCEFIESSNDLNNLTELINNQRPVKVSSRLMDKMKNPVFDLTLDLLADFYLNLTYEDKVCMFESNLNLGNVFNLMSGLSGQHLALYAHWENCGYLLRKKVRTLYEIPDFMPMMLEFTRENWFLLSFNNYKSRNFKKIDIAPGTKLGVLIQIRGSNQVQLKPKEQCLTSGCIELDEIVKQKDLLIFSTSLFDIEYLPASDFNLALLLSATY